MFLIYSLETCPHCKRAISILNELKKTRKIPYEIHNVKTSDKAYYKKKNNMQTFPQIFYRVEKEKFIKIGGADDLEKLVFKS
jgi:glutaredoxin